MAVATKAAAFCVFVRFFEVALGPGRRRLAAGAGGARRGLDRRRQRRRARPELAEAAARLLGHRPGRLHAGRASSPPPRLGVNALVFYLAAYALMNLAAFAVITIRERETGFGDDIRSVQGLGRDRPELAWPLTISMLALAGLPATAGFIGKLYLIEAAVDADYTWLGVVIAVGTMISLAYYLRVIAAVWMRPAPSRGARAGAGCRRWPAARRRPTAERPPRRGASPPPGTRCPAILVPAAVARRGDRLLRRHPLAAGRLGLERGPGAGGRSSPDSAELGGHQVGGCSPNISGRRPARAKSPSISRAPSSSSFGANASRAASRTKSGTLARKVTAGSAARPAPPRRPALADQDRPTLVRRRDRSARRRSRPRSRAPAPGRRRAPSP